MYLNRIFRTDQKNNDELKQRPTTIFKIEKKL